MSTVRDYAAERDEINAVIGRDTVPKVFLRTAGANPDVVAVRRMAGDAPDSWEETTYGALREQVAAVAGGLQAAGLAPGQRIVLMMRNRPEFHVVDLAATFLRATPISIYNSSSPEELQYLVHHSESVIAVVEDTGFLERFLKVRDELPHLERIFVIEPPELSPDDVAAVRRAAVGGASRPRRARRGHGTSRSRHRSSTPRGPPVRRRA